MQPQGVFVLEVIVNSFPVLYLVTLTFLSSVFGAAAVWLLDRPSGEVWKKSRLIAVLGTVFWLVLSWIGNPIDSDEIEHLHASWLISQGLLPYRDFFQHHNPTLWVLLSPILKIFPISPVICDFARFVSLGISVLIGFCTWYMVNRIMG